MHINKTSKPYLFGNQQRVSEIELQQHGVFALDFTSIPLISEWYKQFRVVERVYLHQQFGFIHLRQENLVHEEILRKAQSHLS